ncbi:alpha/beta hydrolase [Pedobacter sp. AW1-32]|uniref:alpha/beta hydrolase n=1 Tax=Pedobacter sp. AW1-32 TaxID=3383026 RepID=UPI003FEF22F3
MLQNTVTAGKALDEAEKALIMIHGRGGSAENILSLSAELNVQDFALIAPQAQSGSWYPQSFLAPRTANEPSLSNALNQLAQLVDILIEKGFAKSQIYILGFSQGACLSLEFAASHAARYGGIVAFTGGLIGEQIDHRNYTGDFDGTPIFIGSSDPDFHVPVSRVQESTAVLENMGAKVTEIIYRDMGHTITQSEINRVNKLIFS